MGNCKDCKFWDTDKTEWSGYSGNFNVCAKIIGDDEEGFLEIAHTIGHYDHASGLVTRSDFGCVLFEAKE